MARSINPAIGQSFWDKSTPHIKWTIDRIENGRCWGKNPISGHESAVIFYINGNNSISLSDLWDYAEPELLEFAAQIIWHPLRNVYGSLNSFRKSIKGQNLPVVFALYNKEEYIYTTRLFPDRCAISKLTFSKSNYYKVVHWLMLNREKLSILIHPLTGDWLKDRTSHAMWLGPKVILKQSDLHLPDEF